MNIPIAKEKYIDERVGIWCIFGESQCHSRVDISDGQRDIFTDIPRVYGEQLIALQEEFRQKLYKLLVMKYDQMY